MDKREKILEVAESLFAQKGFEGTSVRELALKAHINVAMISYYFGSKEKLFEELVEYRSGILREKLVTLSHDEALNPMIKIERLVDYMVNQLFTFNQFHKILLRELTLQQRNRMHDVIADILLRNISIVRNLINEGIRKRVFRKVDAEMVIATLMGTISQATISQTVVCRIIGENPKTYSLLNEKHKARIKKHLIDLMHSHLLIQKRK